MQIYYGRETIEKAPFIYGKIRESFASEPNSSGLIQKPTEGKALVIVPEQFTLQAEREAFLYLRAKSLINVEILSFSRLGFRILGELGGGKKTYIDKRGRFMLLKKILKEQGADLLVYKGMEKHQSFIEKTGDLIYEMKQYDTTAADLQVLLDRMEEDSLLKRKLSDLQRIYLEYERLTVGKYLDGEDYLALFAEKAPHSELVRQSTFWVYGFDSFTPKNLTFMGQLMEHGKDLNVVLVGDENCRDSRLFEVTGLVMNKLSTLAGEKGITCKRISLNGEEALKRKGQNPVLEAVERELYALPPAPFLGGKLQTAPAHLEAEVITLVQAANPYGEAESAAAYARHLLRDKGLKYKEIALICNDTGSRGNLIKRVFAQYGLEIFMDEKRGILHHPVIAFILALPGIVEEGYATRDLFLMLKTGFSGIDEGSIEELENYVSGYRVRGRAIKKPFQKGIVQYGEEGLKALEATRQEVVSFLEPFEKAYKEAETIGEKAAALYAYLAENVNLPGQLELRIKEAEEAGRLEFAHELSMIWEAVISLLDQLVAIVGREKMDGKGFRELLLTGFEAEEIGIIPPTEDCLMLGTMQRTRLGQIKALVVMGANEGILPTKVSEEGLLSEDEKSLLMGQKTEVGKLREVLVKEEALGIYKALSRPRDYLWMSYAISDNEGGRLNPSPIFTQLTRIFPELTVVPDVLSSHDPLQRVVTKDSTFPHFTEALREALSGSEGVLDPIWEAVLDWYRQDEEKCGSGIAVNPLKLLKEGLFYENKPKKIDKELVKKLYSYRSAGEEKVLTLSPSRLERYGRCPFAFFVAHGLKAEEPRGFEITGMDLGDIYHHCFMRLSGDLTKEGIPVTDPASPWMTVTRPESESLISGYLEELGKNYREGLFTLGNEENYRLERIRRVCFDTAWMLICHVRQGQIEGMACEEGFGPGPDKNLPPIEVFTEEGRVQIEGKIDRVDYMREGRVKIVDYKSGREKFNGEEAKAGYRLQLMLYMKAAQAEKSAVGKLREPAGIFYFLIDEPSIDSSSLSVGLDGEEKLAAELRRSFKLDGVVVNAPGVVEDIAGDFTGNSEILPLYKNKEGIVSGTGVGKLLSPEEFTDLQNAVDATVRQLCGDMAKGIISAAPKKTGEFTSCTYCNYKSICRFDLAFPGCRYRVI